MLRGPRRYSIVPQADSFHYTRESCFVLDTGACVFFVMFEVRNVSRTKAYPRRDQNVFLCYLSNGIVAQTSVLLQSKAEVPKVLCLAPPPQNIP
jgi:hypothetical protein